MEFHPTAGIFPMIDDAELGTLADDIKKHGQKNPIYTFEGKILDGRNRFRACQKSKVPAVIEEWKPVNGETPLQFVISQNLHRRHLNESQRAMIATSISSLSQGEKRADAGIPAFTQAEAAKQMNVSRDSVQQAKKVTENAAPEVTEAVKAGEVTVSDAAAVAKEPKAKQKKAVKKVKAGKARTLKQAMDDEAEDVLKDEIDKPVPPGLASVFQAQRLFKGILSQLKEIKATAKKLHEMPAGRFLDVQALELDLNNARRTVRFNMPYAVCPVCTGSAKSRKPNCPCKNSGWLNEANYNLLPSEYRA